VASIIFWSIGALVALAPLPLASNRLWAWSLIALCTGVLLIGWAFEQVRAPTRPGVPLRWHAPATIAYALAVAWAFVQAVGLPGIAPHPLWLDAARAAGGISPHAAISLDPGASVTGAVRLMAYAAVFWLSLQVCRDARRARQLLAILVASGTAYALYGLFVQFSDLDSILWYRKWAYSDALTATFVNRNSFATYAGMVTIAAMALLASESDRAVTTAGGYAARVVDTFDRLRGRAYAVLGGLLIVTTALLLTESRAGIASTIFGIVVFFGALAVYRYRRGGRTAPLATATILVALSLAAISGKGAIDRLTEVESGIAGRAAVWSLTRDAAAERPLSGTGLGSFDDVYLAMRDETLSPTTPPFLRAHNSYIENALELGLPGLALLVLAIAWLAVWCGHGVLNRRRDGIYSCVALGTLALSAMHATVDFSLQIPAVNVVLAALLGAGCAQANRTRAQAGDNLPVRGGADKAG
jgi:O-antigen ligase